MYSEEITGIVLDMGSNTMKSGYSGDDGPRYVTPSKVILREQKSKMEIENDNSDKLQNIYDKHDLLWGDEYLNHKKEGNVIRDLINNAIIQDYDLYEKTVQYILEKQLKLSCNQFPLMMSENMGQTIKQREKITEIMFDGLQATNFFMCKNPVLSSFSTGRSSSLVLDSGESMTNAVAVLDGYALQKTMIRFEVGGRFITNRLLHQLEKQNNKKIHPRFCYNVRADKDGNRQIEYIGQQKYDQSFYDYHKNALGQTIKEQILYVDDEELMQKVDRNEYELPDGKVVQLGEYRNMIVESQFEQVSKKRLAQDHQISQQLMGFKGYQYMVLDTINNCDIDLRKDLYNNIMLVGGNTLVPGFDEVFTKKLQEIVTSNTKIKLITHPNPIERMFSSWIGGSVLSSLGTFQNMWITKAEYEEHGTNIINKKCP